MPRNYEKEVEWRKKKYGEIRAQIDKPLVEKFKDKLKSEGLSVAEWLRVRIAEYLGE